jgi:16S rRNA (guanine527-N7)-methyltransferase
LSVDTDPPPAAARLFGDRLPQAVAFARLLATDAVVRGLIGPGEADRLWERHLLNCAAVAEAVPPGVHVVDLGSGAGLPGIALALARPDLTVDLVEPMSRRTVFLDEVVAALGLSAVRVVRARADAAERDRYDVVTARALAPLDRLVAMALPLARPGGVLLAMKGASAAAELRAAGDAVRAAGGERSAVLLLGVGLLDPPTAVVTVHRATNAGLDRSARRRQRGGAGAR